MLTVWLVESKRGKRVLEVSKNYLPLVNGFSHKLHKKRGEFCMANICYHKMVKMS